MTSFDRFSDPRDRAPIVKAGKRFKLESDSARSCFQDLWQHEYVYGTWNSEEELFERVCGYFEKAYPELLNDVKMGENSQQR